MLRVCEQLREADAKTKRHGLKRAETDYVRALLAAMANMDRLVEVEVLKSLGDVNLETGKRCRGAGKLDRALALYRAALLRCEDADIKESLTYRLSYVKKLRLGKKPTAFVRNNQNANNKEVFSLAEVAERFQRLDQRLSVDYKKDALLIEYTKLVIEGITKEDNMLEVEAIKSLGDVYLKRGTETRDTTCLTKATALYNTALARCEGIQGTVALIHRLLYTAKIRQGKKTRHKGVMHRRQHQQQALSHMPRDFPVMSTKIGVIADTTCHHFLSPSSFIASQTPKPASPDYRSYKKCLTTEDRALADGNLDLVKMMRVCEQLREADAKTKRHGLTRTETDYLRALFDAMANMDGLVEVEVLKSLGDLNLETGKRCRGAGKLDRALVLYRAALLRCEDLEIRESLAYRTSYAEKLRLGKEPTAFVRNNHNPNNKEVFSLADVAERFQSLDQRLTADYMKDSLLIEYTKLMIEGITKEDNMLEVEAIKSLGDVYLKRGTETRDTTCLTKATALYNTALARCEGIQGTVALIHRLLYTARIRQEKKTRLKGVKHRGQHQQQALSHMPMDFPVMSTKIGVIADTTCHHFLSPSSFIAGQTPKPASPDYRSYEKCLKTGDRALADGNLDLAEQRFASALKLIQGPTSTTIDRSKEAECLCRLGEVYLQRGKRTKEGRAFTQAAALYNAALARTDKKETLKALQEIELSFLRCTANIDTEPNPSDYIVRYKKKLNDMRVHVESQLEDIDEKFNPYKYDEDDPIMIKVEAERAEAVKALCKRIANDRQIFIKDLLDECIATLAPPPCQYAFIGLGSQATEMVTPYSDLEFAILIEDGKDNDDTRQYFLTLTHYLHLRVINLGETILPAMAIPSLNDFQSDDPEKDWFFDSVTPRGFAFDGFMPWACKTPFGRDKTKNKPLVSLIQTPAKMAEFQRLEISLAEGYHLSDILRRVVFLAGEQSLVNEYMAKLKEITNGDLPSQFQSRFSAIQILYENREHILTHEPTEQLLNVKKDIYRSPGVAIELLALCYQIMLPSSWSIIDELKRTNRIREDDVMHLTVLTSISAELRLRTYMANGGQNDRLSPLAKMNFLTNSHEMSDTHLRSVFHIPDSKVLFRYYCRVIPLKKCMPDIVKDSFQVEHGPVFKTSIYDTSHQCRGRIARELLLIDKSICHWETALKEVDNIIDRIQILDGLGRSSADYGNHEKAISYFEELLTILKAVYADNEAHPNIAMTLKMLGTSRSKLGDHRNAISNFQQALRMQQDIYGENAIHRDIFSTLLSFGLCLSEHGYQESAISYFKQSLTMSKTLHGDDTAHVDIAMSLNNLGLSWSKLGDKKKAISYYEMSLKMCKTIYGDMTAHPFIASLLDNLGVCWNELGDHMKAIRYLEQSQALMKGIYGDKAIHPYIAKLLNNLGTYWGAIGNEKKALSYYEQSVTMKKALYGTTHPDVAISLSNIASSWQKLGYQTKAINCCEEALGMLQEIYGKGTDHPGIATLLSVLGVSWSELGDYKKAISYEEQSLTMMKSIYKDKHPDIAKSLHNLGSLWSDLGDETKAINYYEQSLRLLKTISGDSTAHPDIALLLSHVGISWKNLGELQKSRHYYEQALSMRITLHGDETAHPHIAESLTNLGTFWYVLGDPKKAIKYEQQALEMHRIIYGEDTEHPCIASSLNNLGAYWNKLGDLMKGISFYEQSLSMRQIIYGHTAHPDIAESLNNLGASWAELGDLEKATSYIEQAIMMRKIIYGENTAHPNIALSLRNMGSCYQGQLDAKKAISYHEQALKMYKVIYGDNTAHGDIAKTLHNLGTCWDALGDGEKAIRFHEQSLTMMKTVYGYNKAHPDIAKILASLGMSYGDYGDQTKALSFCEQSLDMLEEIYGRNTTHPDIAFSLEILGLVWCRLGDHVKAVKFCEQSLVMMKTIYHGMAHPGIALSLSVLGLSYHELGDWKKSVSYHEQSLAMTKTLLVDKKAHPKIALLLNSIGSISFEVGSYNTAKTYFEQSLTMTKTLYGDKAHPDIADSLNNLAVSWSGLGHQRKAISYFEQSLAMRKAVYGGNNAHPDIVASLNNLGMAWSKLGDTKKAMTYYQQSLTMGEAICGENKDHSDIDTLHNLGNLWSQLGEQNRAIGLLEQSLTMEKSRYGQNTPHPGIAMCLNNLGSCWCRQGNHQEAIRYYEQALAMRKTIYGDNMPHPHIASSLNDLGIAWSGLGYQHKGIYYHEQSLAMKRTIYGNNAMHPGIAGSLINLAACWDELGDHKKAIRYREQSLSMTKIIFGDDAINPHISDSLFVLGLSWSKLGDHKNAIKYYEQSLAMKKAIHGEHTVRPDIMMCIYELHEAWGILGNERKSLEYCKQLRSMLPDEVCSEFDNIFLH
ncbi:uncharacterized protein LOC144922023 [Branchiostoma floridae x Branchiostoma belcheri]